MKKYTYSWSNVRDNDPNVRINHEYTTFSEDDQEAEDYARKKTQEFMDDFNNRTSATTKGHIDHFVLVSVEEVKKIEIPKNE